MKKITFSILALAAVAAFAGVASPLQQFGKVLEGETATTAGYYYVFSRESQPDVPLIQMHVPAKSTVWLTHMVNTWDSVTLEVPDLDGNDGTKDLYNMTGDKKYGYIYASAIEGLDAEKSTYQSAINWSDGSQTKDITYIIDNSDIPEENGLEVTAKGYLLDTFEQATDIYLVMTPYNTLPKEEDLDTYQFADDGAGPHETTLLDSRDIPGLDKASNYIVTFGIVPTEAQDYREFVAVYDQTEVDGGGASGQPLPGLLLAGLLSLGTVAAGKKMKKRA